MTSEGRVPTPTGPIALDCLDCGAAGPCEHDEPADAGRVASNYTITVQAFDMTDDQIDALFDRVADAAHALDEQVTVGGGRLTPPARTPSSTTIGRSE